MRHQYSPSSERTDSLLVEVDSRQHLSSLVSTYPNQRVSGYFMPPTHPAPLHIQSCAQAGQNFYDSNRPPFQANSTMIGHQDSCTQHQTETRMRTYTEPNECSMSYQEAIGLVNEYSPEALEAINAAHLHSTRPVIISLRDEVLYVKHLLQIYAKAFPNFLDPHMFRNLYAEQPEAFPLPAPKPSVYASAYAPISPASSDASSPTISASNSPSPPVISYDSPDGRTPPKLPYYVESTASEVFTPTIAYSSEKDGRAVPASYDSTSTDRSRVYNTAAYGSFYSTGGPPDFGEQSYDHS